jgi:hypothetical protein
LLARLNRITANATPPIATMPAKTSIVAAFFSFFSIRSARERPLVLKMMAQSAFFRETSFPALAERLVAF